MLQVNLVSPKQFVLEEVEKPRAAAGQAVIAVQTAGICGSDIHAYYGKHPFISCPIVPGHEFVGIVEEAPGNESLVGKRVTVLPSLVCSQCFNCRTGHSNICEQLKVIGCQAPGAFAEYVLVPADKVFVLPEEIDWNKGVLVEPLAVGVHAVRRLAKLGGKTVWVLGAGTIGLMTVAVLKAYGAGKIVVSDFNTSRLRLAQKLGADVTLNPKDVDQAMLADLGQIDAAFECVGIGATVNQAIQVVRKGGDIVVVGVYEEDVPVKMGLVQDKELSLIGTLMYDKEDYAEAIRLLQQGLDPITELITHRYPLRDAAAAYKLIEDQPDQVVKVVLDVATDLN